MVKMSVRISAFIICLLLLWNQCNSHLIQVLENEEEESAIKELKVAKQIETGNELTLLQFLMFGKPYSFKLTPANSIFSPNFQILRDMFKDDNNEFDDNYLISQESESLAGSFYIDEDGKGSFYIEQDENGQIQMDGFVNDQVVITNKKGHHTALKLASRQLKFDRTLDTDWANQTSVKRQTQHKTATIEVLVFLDQIVYNTLKQRNASIKKYLGIFWNTVQSKYQVFLQPKVKFSLSGAIPINKNMKWMTETFLQPNKPDDNKFLNNFGFWLFEENSIFPQFDVAAMHTGLDLSYEKNKKVYTETLGIAPRKGICTVDEKKKQVASICVIEDFNAPIYNGALVATHEVGHLLNANHDGTKNCRKYGIMAPELQQVSPSVLMFSDCSIAEITEELNSDGSYCLFDSPRPNLPIGPNMPTMTRQEICHLAYGQSFSAASMDVYDDDEADPCVYVICIQNEGTRYENRKLLPWVPERTACGDNRVCIKGKCVKN